MTIVYEVLSENKYPLHKHISMSQYLSHSFHVNWKIVTNLPMEQIARFFTSQIHLISCPVKFCHSTHPLKGQGYRLNKQADMNYFPISETISLKSNNKYYR